MVYIGFVSRILLAIIFFIAAFGKTRHHAAFQLTLQHLSIGRSISPILTWIVIFYELVLAILFIMEMFVQVAMVMFSCFVLVGICISLYALILRQKIPCHCFGKSSSPLGLATITRLFLLVLPAGMYLLSTLSIRTVWWPSDVAMVVSLASLILAFILLAHWLFNISSIFILIRDRKNRENSQHDHGHVTTSSRLSTGGNLA